LGVIGDSRAEANECSSPLPSGDLHQAKPVAAELKAHRLGVDGDRTGAEHVGGKIFLVKMNAHASGIRAGHMNAQWAQSEAGRAAFAASFRILRGAPSC
jgi:hypothetical protein